MPGYRPRNPSCECFPLGSIGTKVYGFFVCLHKDIVNGSLRAATSRRCSLCGTLGFRLPWKGEAVLARSLVLLKAQYHRLWVFLATYFEYWLY